jgi:hypothetical protein
MKNKLIFLIVITCLASLLPYLLVEYVRHVDLTLLQTIGFIIWLILVFTTLKIGKWNKKLYWLFIFFPIAGWHIVLFGYFIIAFIFGWRPN